MRKMRSTAEISHLRGIVPFNNPYCQAKTDAADRMVAMRINDAWSASHPLKNTCLSSASVAQSLCPASARSCLIC